MWTKSVSGNGKRADFKLKLEDVMVRTDLQSPLWHWSPTLGLQMLLDFNSQKSWSAKVVVKNSGRCSLRPSGGPRLGTTALWDSVAGYLWWKHLSRVLRAILLVTWSCKRSPSSKTIFVVVEYIKQSFQWWFPFWIYQFWMLGLESWKQGSVG